MQIQYELQTFFRHATQDQLGIRIVHDMYKLSQFFKVKESQVLLHRSNVVYHITCNCGSSYIGETQRNFVTRLHKHNPDSTTCKDTDVSEHLANNTGHKIDFDNPKILCTARNRTKLLILETLKINRLNPQINVDQFSIVMYLFNN